MVRMDVMFEQMGDELFGMGSKFGSPSNHPRWGPFQIRLVGFGEVFVEGGEPSFLVTSDMGSDTSILEEDLDGT